MDTITELKEQPQKWKKIFARHKPVKWLTYKIYKETL
jgi:hypothetical protein